MKKLLLSFATALLALLYGGCRDEITNINGPADWQGPTVEWTSPMDAEVRGTIGLDVSVQDSSSILRVKLYLDGGEDQTLTVPPWRFTIFTDSLADGVHLCEARAWDQYENLGISPVLRVNVVNSIAQGPRVLWVPDSVQTIQSAINAATDYDTIRVRDGTYYETLNLFGKGIWIESEHGPLACQINGGGRSNLFFVAASQERSTIRGFTMAAAFIQVLIDDGAQLDLFNNMFLATTWEPSYPPDSTYTFVQTGSVAGLIVNNLFSGSRTPLQLFTFFGSVENNVVQRAYDYGLWNANVSENPVFHAYNAFWLNPHNYAGFSEEVGEFQADPLLDLVGGRLLPGSPCIDTGDPEILDLDGTRSDIGPFGGPLGYR